MGHAGHKAQRTDSGTGGICRRLKLDLLAHARHLCRPACRRVLEAKWKLGLFADPYRYCNEKRAKKEIFTPDDLMFYNQQIIGSEDLLSLLQREACKERDLHSR